MLKILTGDCMDVLPTLAADSVQCCVTSPPYWGLRDYGTATWEGGDAEHKHDTISARNGRGGSGSPGKQTQNAFPSELPAAICRCGARRIDSQFGLESTPEEYLAKMVAVFREVWRVLRNDGTLWVNMGDSYAANRTYQVTDNKHVDVGNNGASKIPPGLKPKDLCMMPARLAIALQANGWYLRSDIIWHKPNPMPESVTDRPTKSHEYIFLLAKREHYYYDAASIYEQTDPDNWRKSAGQRRYPGQSPDTGFLNGREYSHRNKRTVWTVATQPYSDAHFATFPEDLIKPCIMAGSRVGDTVLDPFGGSGTTGKVALELGRRSILIDLNPKYVELAKRRTNVTPSLFCLKRESPRQCHLTG